MSRNSERHIKKVVQVHRKWLDNTGAWVLETNSRDLEELVPNGTFPSVSSAVDAIGTYYGIAGVLALLDGSADGVQQLRIAVECASIASHLNLTSGETHSSYVAACVGCVSKERAVAVTAKLHRIEGRIPVSFWQDRVFEPWVIECWKHFEGQPFDLPRTGGVYRSIFENWHDLDKLSHTLFDVAEYHCRNMRDVSEWKPEFCLPPFDLIPCEWILVNRIRTAMGLETRFPEHPLASFLGLPLEPFAEVRPTFLQPVRRLIGFD